MKIVCYVNKVSGGGAERVMSVLANGLVRKGHLVDLVVDYETDNEYPLDKRVNKHVMNGRFSQRAGNPILRNVGRVRFLRRLCKQRKAQVLISFIQDANVRALLATPFTGTRNIISVRNDPKSIHGHGIGLMLAKLIAKTLYPCAEGCVFQTEEVRSWYTSKTRRKSRIILNPVSEAFYRLPPVEQREKRIVTCGRLSEQKNHSLLIRSFAALDKRFSDYTLHIYGEGPDRDKLEALCCELGVKSRVVFEGRTNNIPEAIRAAALFVLSSDFEGLPNALMEAMALGLPVISTDCSGGGARVLLRDEKNGRIVPCQNENALTHAMQACLLSPDVAKEYGLQARKDAEQFRVERIIDSWEAYIRDVVQKKGKE